MKKLANGIRNFYGNKIINAVAFVGLLLVVPYIIVIIPEAIRFSLGNRMFWEYIVLRLNMLAVSYIVFFLLHAALTALTRRVSVSAGILCLLSMAAGIVNKSKLIYRGEPVLPSDLYLIKDALAITQSNGIFNTIEISKTAVFLTVCSVLLLVLFLPVRIPAKLTGKTRRMRILRTTVFTAACFCLLALFINKAIYNETLMEKIGHADSVNIAQQYDANTFYTEFLITSDLLTPEKPTDYGRYTMRSLAADVEAHRNNGEEERVDIIVLLVESWADPVAYDAVFDRNVFENYDRLSAQGVSGSSISPYIGGGTANIEFELLTGFSSNDEQAAGMTFNIYQYDYMNEGFPCIGGFLRENGYGTYAIHAYTSELYNREENYPLLGFEKSDTFENPLMSGPYISDESCVDKIIEVYEDAVRRDDNVFIHALTMQNHIIFGENRYADNELIGCTSETYSEEDAKAMAEYGTAIWHTDQAIGNLADYLSTVDRKVMLVVVGDHQPALCAKSETTEYLLEKYGYYDAYDPETDFADVHATPYLVWTNYDDSLNGTTFGTIVPNELLVNALGAYDVLRPAYFDYFYTQFDSMNGATSNYCVGLDNKVYFTMNEDQLADYHIRQLIQYDLVYSEQYLRESIY